MAEITQPILFNSGFSFAHQHTNGRNQTYLMIFYVFVYAFDMILQAMPVMAWHLIKDIIEFGIWNINDSKRKKERERI